MGVEFSISNFLLPKDLVEFRLLFKKYWKASKADVNKFQMNRLRRILSHAASQVPFYIETFSKHGLSLNDFNTVEDIKKLPIITRQDILKNPSAFHARNKEKFSPQPTNTSGTSGQRFDFLLDKRTNALEFNYYWRYWNLAGYHLGDRFVEFSTMYFLKRNSKKWIESNLITGRSIFNCIYMTSQTALTFLDFMVRKNVQFMKGPPSTLSFFTHFIVKGNHHFPKLKAIFSTSEVLSYSQRKSLESAWKCRVFDSYGHMERVVAACECPLGRMHINSDYGLMEIENGQVLATSLHNMSMPLIRYNTGDIAEVGNTSAPCPCGSFFPTIKIILGREEDIIVTPEGRAITGLFQVFNNITEIQCGQIIYEKPDTIRVLISPGSNYTESTEKIIIQNIGEFVGPSMKINIEKVGFENMQKSGHKFKHVVAPKNLNSN